MQYDEEQLRIRTRKEAERKAAQLADRQARAIARDEKRAMAENQERLASSATASSAGVAGSRQVNPEEDNAPQAHGQSD